METRVMGRLFCCKYRCVLFFPVLFDSGLRLHSEVARGSHGLTGVAWRGSVEVGLVCSSLRQGAVAAFFCVVARPSTLARTGTPHPILLEPSTATHPFPTSVRFQIRVAESLGGKGRCKVLLQI